jgi:hypothetical protein
MKTKNNLIKTANFIEEFSWFLKSKKNINLEETANLLREISNQKQIETNSINHNVNELVGVLPFLFQDKELFKYNKDIIDFAEDLFNITITRQNKRTRYELIGLVVTEVTTINKTTLNKLVNTLSLITNDINTLKEIKKAKQDINFTWNQAISNLNQ